MEVTVRNSFFYNMPNVHPQGTYSGLTTRQLLKEIRAIYWGSIGNADFELSDGTDLHVGLVDRKMHSHIITRSKFNGNKDITFRTYPMSNVSRACN